MLHLTWLPGYIEIEQHMSVMKTSLAPALTGIIVQRTGSFIPALILGAGIAATSALIYTFVVRRPVSGADLDAVTG